MYNYNLGGGNSKIFYFHSDPWGNDPIWRAYSQMGWNHQQDNYWPWYWFESTFGVPCSEGVATRVRTSSLLMWKMIFGWLELDLLRWWFFFNGYESHGMNITMKTKNTILGRICFVVTFSFSIKQANARLRWLRWWSQRWDVQVQ